MKHGRNNDNRWQQNSTSNFKAIQIVQDGFIWMKHGRNNDNRWQQNSTSNFKAIQIVQDGFIWIKHGRNNNNRCQQNSTSNFKAIEIVQDGSMWMKHGRNMAWILIPNVTVTGRRFSALRLFSILFRDNDNRWQQNSTSNFKAIEIVQNGFIWIKHGRNNDG